MTLEEPTKSRRLVPPLYRYLSLANDKLHGRFEKVIRERRIWYTSPADFNDPFECKFRMLFDAPTPQKVQQCVKFLVRQVHLKRAQANRIAKKHFTGTGRERLSELEKAGHACMQEMLNNETGMLCLSEVSDDILMWSHYADGHRGVCLVFDYRPPQPSREQIEFFASVFPVAYQEEFPTMDFYSVDFYSQNDQMEQLRKTVLTKASHWSYEHERRALDQRAGCHLIPRGIITGVILGMEMRDDQRQRVTALVRDADPPIALFEARKVADAYKLEIVTME